MRYAFFSDVHANLEALEAVFRDMEQEGVEKVACLGDLVGYGPWPNECIQRVQEITPSVVVGNHDWGAIGRADLETFNVYARMAIEWTQQQLTEESRQYLRSLPLQLQLDDFTLVHASPRYPEEWEYILTLDEAIDNFDYFSTSVCLIGHSHVPIIIFKKGERYGVLRETEIEIDPEARYIINIGSVGQPRDFDPRACYVIYDSSSRKFQFRRISYNIQATQSEMLENGLPNYLIERLSYGQ